MTEQQKVEAILARGVIVHGTTREPILTIEDFDRVANTNACIFPLDSEPPETGITVRNFFLSRL